LKIEDKSFIRFAINKQTLIKGTTL